MTDKITLTAMRPDRGFQIEGLNGYTLSIGIGNGHYCENKTASLSVRATSTMEVAILDGLTREFVVLPWDVAGYVPVGNLAPLIVAVQGHEWKRVCRLCGVDASDPENKFPLKNENEV